MLVFCKEQQFVSLIQAMHVLDKKNDFAGGGELLRYNLSALRRTKVLCIQQHLKICNSCILHMC